MKNTAEEIEILNKHIDFSLDGIIHREDAVKAMHEYAEVIAVEFAEWKAKNSYTQFGANDNVDHIHPDYRGSNRYRFNKLWYNTINIDTMNKPLTTKQLFDLFREERNKKSPNINPG